MATLSRSRLSSTESRLWWRVVDAGLAFGLCLLDLLLFSDPGPDQVPAVVGFAAAGYAVLLFRRAAPTVVLAAMAAHVVGAVALDLEYMPTFGLWLALGTVAFHRSLRTAAAALAVTFAASGLGVAYEAADAPTVDRAGAFLAAAIGISLVNAGTFGVARWARWSVERRRLEAQQAAERAITAERTQIAREMHDVIAHGVTLMLIQAGGAAGVLRTDPDRALAALGRVDTLGQQAIEELRRLLGVLDRTPGSRPQPEAQDTEPLTSSPSGVDRLPALVEQLSASHPRARLHLTGRRHTLEPGVDHAVFRIVQEALTNCARYAPVDGDVRVDVQWHDDELRLRVVNDVAAPGTGRRGTVARLSTGSGLVGMSERARAAGGRLEAGPLADGSFRVELRLPLHTPSPEPGDRPASRRERVNR